MSGTVTDAETGASLPGVNVVVKGTTIGTATDADGSYSLSVPSAQDTLVFSFIGYETKEVAIAGRSTVDIALPPSTAALEEVVVVGYGTQERQDLTGSVAVVDAEELAQRAPSMVSVADALKGTVAGLNITTRDFSPGAGASILVRGINSITASNAPLIVVDGIPFSGSLNDLNPYDIASISILKDASSAAIYGARAANGVILIETKQGQAGELTVNYNGYVGVQRVSRRMDVMEPGEFLEMRRAYVAAEQGVDPSSLTAEDLLFADTYANYQKGQTTDWQAQIYRPALQTKHQLSVSGGSEATQYYLSLGYLTEDGVVKGNSFNRLSLRANLDFSLTDWWDLDTNLQLTQKDYQALMGDWAIGRAVHLSPYGSVRDSTAAYNYYPNYPDVFYPNPFADYNRTHDDKRRKAFLNLRTDLELPFVEGLTYTARVGASVSARRDGDYYGRNMLTGLHSDGLAELYQNRGLDWTLENILNYETVFAGTHSLDVTLLYSRQHSAYESSSLSGEGFVSDALDWHAIDLAQDPDIGYDTYYSEWDLVSYMARLNYDYDNRYLLTLTARRDGYSGFGRNDKYGFFPAVALAWNVAEESFFAVETVDQLKLRVSYGVNGNQAVGPYQTLDLLGSTKYIFGDNGTGALGVVKSQRGNQNLRWESTRQLNLGVDFSVLDRRISGAIDYFRSYTYDLLLSRKIPIMNNGASSILDNVGKIRTWGLDVVLDTRNVAGADFSWRSNLNFSMSRDRIVSLYGNKKDDVGNGWFIGEPVRVYYDYVVAGIWQKGDDIAASAQPNARPGDPRIRDVNGDGVITADDRVIIGRELPDFRVGFTNTFTYKNFTLSAVVTWVQGGVRANRWLDPTSWLLPKHTNYLEVDYWTPEDPSTRFPRLGYINNLGHGFYQDPSYVRLRDVTLSYDVPGTDRLGLERLRVYANVRNLITFTDWIGPDPEQAYGGYGDGLYPNATTLLLGLNLSF